MILAAAWLIATALMTALWALAVRRSNLGLVDLGWTLSVLVFATAATAFGTGDPTHRALAGTLAALWSARLAWHLARRLFANLDREDPRYASLRKKWSAPGKNLAARAFVLFQFEVLLALVLSVPYFALGQNPNVELNALEIIGLTGFALAWMGESLSDYQLEKFKRDPSNRARVCDVGLWCYSRHPNYFFDWLSWVFLALLAMTSPFGWAAWIAPVIMWVLLTKVTGVPMNEAQSLKTRGPAYREYQARTSRFVPWFPRTAKGRSS